MRRLSLILIEVVHFGLLLKKSKAVLIETPGPPEENILQFTLKSHSQIIFQHSMENNPERPTEPAVADWVDKKRVKYALQSRTIFPHKSLYHSTKWRRHFPLLKVCCIF